MGKPRSRKQAKAFSSEAGTGSRAENPSDKARPARRSIVELTEAACRAAGDGLLSPVVIAPGSDQPLSAGGKAIASDVIDAGAHVSPSSWPRLTPPSTPSAASSKDMDARHLHDESVEAVDRVSRTESVARSATCDAAGGESEKHDPQLAHHDASGTCELNVSDSTADMAVKIAKAYQANALDDIKVGFSAALDYAAEFAKGRASSEAAAGHAPADSNNRLQNTLAAEYRAEAVEMMKANVATTLDFARQLFNARTSAEWVELASTHARMQCELMVQQGRTLRSLARSMTIPAAEQAGPRRTGTRK
jgi:Phasin protein